MTDLQLLLSSGIPSLLIALAMISGRNSRFNSMDKRMDDMNDRMKKMDADAREFRVEHRQELVTIQAEHRRDFSAISTDIRDFRVEHRQDLVAIHADLQQFYGMTTKLEGRVDEISKR